MSTSTLVRRSGLVLMLGGIVIVLYDLLIRSTGGIDAGARAVLTSTWMLGQSLHLLGGALVLFGLLGVYAQQRDSLGRLGLAGFVLALLATTLFVGAGMIQAYVLPSVVALQPGFVDRGGPYWSGPILTMFAATDVSRWIGYILLGLAIIRSNPRRVWRWAAVLVMIGAVLGALPPLPAAVREILLPIGNALFGIGLVGWGYALWSEAGQMTRQVSPARASG